MNSGLVFDNKKYISAKEAASLTGYSQDYIGQLSRGNKIDSKRIGRVWYVCEDSLLRYKNFSNELGVSSLSSLKTNESSNNLSQSLSKVSTTPEKTLYQKSRVFSDTLGNLKKKYLFPVFEKVKPYIQFLDEVVFGSGWSLSKKLLPLALGLVLILGV